MGRLAYIIIWVLMIIFFLAWLIMLAFSLAMLATWWGWALILAGLCCLTIIVGSVFYDQKVRPKEKNYHDVDK